MFLGTRGRGGGWAVVGLVFALSACRDEPPQEVGDRSAERPPVSFRIANGEFRTPEAVIHDDAADVYLVSNINGDPFGKDGNGFISRISGEGAVLDLRWIDGDASGVTLHAPKGMALHGERLYVADIDVVRVFDRDTGRPIEEIPVEGASFLNDVAAAPDGTVYVTDTGVAPGFAPTGTDAVHAIRDGRVERLVGGAELALPNGITVRGDELLMVPFGSHTVFAIPLRGGEPRVIAELPAGQLDGVIALEDGTLLVSSWEGGAVYRVDPDGKVGIVVGDLRAPAAIGYDATRNRVLIPLFEDNRVEVRELRESGLTGGG
jgi:hypothetical protein